MDKWTKKLNLYIFTPFQGDKTELQGQTFKTCVKVQVHVYETGVTVQEDETGVSPSNKSVQNGPRLFPVQTDPLWG